MHSLPAYLRKVKHTDEHTQFPIFLPSCMRVLGLGGNPQIAREKIKTQPRKSNRAETENQD